MKCPFSFARSCFKSLQISLPLLFLRRFTKLCFDVENTFTEQPDGRVLTGAPELAPIVKLKAHGREPSAFQTDTEEVIWGQNGFPDRGDASYYFYQILPHYYLSTIDIKLLRAAFGAYSDLISTILPRVGKVATGYSVDDDFRKGANSVVHIPYSYEISFMDCECADIVSAEVLETFRIEIDQWKKGKQEKDARKKVAWIQCSQRGSPSVLSPDEDGRLFVVPSRPPGKLPDDSGWGTSGPTVAYPPTFPYIRLILLVAGGGRLPSFTSIRLCPAVPHRSRSLSAVTSGHLPSFTVPAVTGCHSPSFTVIHRHSPSLPLTVVTCRHSDSLPSCTVDYSSSNTTTTGTGHLSSSRPVQGSWQSVRRALSGPWTVGNTAWIRGNNEEYNLPNPIPAVEELQAILTNLPTQDAHINSKRCTLSTKMLTPSKTSVQKVSSGMKRWISSHSASEQPSRLWPRLPS
ncbi:hypothetical protein B9Z19DRAFT_1121691 [Tuber borchii]|uniref:Uncharacterized protein n=1 Tax=Tuber borchii TaxID=42251 RepID=A0A2T7A212_TUBBO|nr:hypothetical protein B9Z19DRAFT_1121691 [Tuber borchii]